MFGRMMNETLGKVHFWVTLVSFNCVFIPLFLAGAAGNMRRVYNPMQYDFLKHLAGIHQFATIATIVLLIGQVPFIVNFFWSLFAGKRATDNPWKANTLEWATASPPPHGNFEKVPTVYRDPYEYSLPGLSDDYLPQYAPAPAPRGV
jgi:cytochrome c oxidase subunit 1